MTVLWEDPPPDRRFQWVSVLTPLMERPGCWARIREGDSGGVARKTAHNLNSRKVQIPPGRWEFVSRSKDGTHYVYARYLGPENGQP